MASKWPMPKEHGAAPPFNDGSDGVNDCLKGVKSKGYLSDL